MLPNLTMEVKTDPLNTAFPQKRRYFSTTEKKCLVTCYEKFKHILDLKSTTACSNQKKNEAWDSLTELYNSMPHVNESHASKQQLKDLYKNLKRNAKKQDVDIMTLLENGDPMGVSLDSTAFLDGCDPTDKTLLEVVPLSCPLDNNRIIKIIKCEVIEEDRVNNASCDMSSNCSDCVVTSTPHEKSINKRVVDVIENSSNSPGCAVTSTPSEENINQKVLDILKNSINTAKCPATPFVEESNDEQQIDGPISSSHPTSTTTHAEENLITSYKKKRKEPASVKAAYALHNQSVTRLKQLEEEHELIKKKLRLEINYQINSEKRAEAQHRLMMERIKREDEQSEKLQAAKLRALEAKARYFESKMGAL